MSSLKIDILTLFPNMFSGPFEESLLKKAQKAKRIDIQIHDLRKFSREKHHKVDDTLFGGGPGMLLKAEPLVEAIEYLSKKEGEKPWVIYLSPQGKTLKQSKALELSQKKHLLLVCGHYEGIDERVMDWIDEEISIGDFVLTGGEFPAMVLVDAVCRLVPGVVKEWESIINDSFFSSKLDYAQYTRPADFKGKKVPEVLLSGNHKEIKNWRETNALNRTLKKRPELANVS